MRDWCACAIPCPNWIRKWWKRRAWRHALHEEKDQYEAQIKDRRGEGYTDKSDIEALKAELLSLEAEVKKLRQSSKDTSGTNVRAFIGEGNRQYLTGLNLGGQHIAILLDTSASMLADKLVQIIRLRNMNESVQRSAEKWTQNLKTVDWLTAQLPVSSKYQVITFNTQARAALPGTEGKWLEVADQAQLANVGGALRKIIPSGGTSLENAFLALRNLSPPPDNIFLITDGLPTQGTTPPRGSKVSGQERQRLYAQALRQLPGRVPVNIILAPMEGDPMAAAAFWQLAQYTQRLSADALARLALMAKRRVRRSPAEGSLSFLDVICCGFGSIILLLMITKTVQPQIIEASTVNLQGKLAELQDQLFNIRGETTVLNRDLNAKQEQVIGV